MRRPSHLCLLLPLVLAPLPLEAAAPARKPAPAAATKRPPAAPEKLMLMLPDLPGREAGEALVGALVRVQGVASAVVDARTRLAVVDYRPDQVTPARVLAACREAGQPAAVYRPEERFPRPIKLKGG